MLILGGGQLTITVEVITVETIAVEVITSCADPGGGGQLTIAVEAIASSVDPGGGGN